MNSTLKSVLPYLLIILGMFLLFYMGMASAAGVCLLIGIVMIIEKKWPEEWHSEKY